MPSSFKRGLPRVVVQLGVKILEFDTLQPPENDPEHVIERLHPKTKRILSKVKCRNLIKVAADQVLMRNGHVR